MEPIKQSAPYEGTVQGAISSDYPSWLIDSGVYGLSGFALGFIVKRLGRLFFWAIALIIVLLLLAHYNKGNVINIAPLQDFFNEHATTSLDGFIQHIVAIARAHSAATLSLCIGFILGWYVG